jgi:hypothetical protein
MEASMAQTAQSRAVANYRKRLISQGLPRWEVLGRRDDKDLLRVVAKKLAESGEAESALRQSIAKIVEFKSDTRGEILAALRNSPLAGSGIRFKREKTSGRKIEL